MSLSLDRRIEILNGEVIDAPPPQRALVPVEIIDVTAIEMLPPLAPPYEYADPDPPEPEGPQWYHRQFVEISPEAISFCEPGFLARLASSVVLGLFLPAPRTITRRR